MTEVFEQAHRKMCYDCHKPYSQCICDAIIKIKNQTHVLILQHPRERFHAIGTARIASLALANSHLEVAWKGFCDQENIGGLLQTDAGILYPSDDAVDLADVPSHALPKQLVVLDGTWHTAKQIYRDHRVLHGLPKFALSPLAPSQYRIRKAPKPEQRSTIEAIWQALLHIEPNTTDLDSLLVVFKEMIDRQMAFSGHPSPRKKHPKHTQRKPLPEALTTSFESLVIGYGEFIPSPQTPLGYQLLVWTAYKPASGETFSATLGPDGPDWVTPSSDHLNYMECRTSDILDGMSLADFKSAWNAFTGPEYTLATWNEITHRLFRELLNEAHPAIQLKRVYCSLSGGKCGALHTVLENHGLTPVQVGVGMRAGLRLGNAASIAQFLREVGLERLETGPD